ncbi:hypothetical protein BDM02DRAFT_3183250 [Thelephora ganbajun]|uniref:Uncharacterized protein n=1 Tax=Thelephora ganbajun TaxID=370292 RepID=A0ACB6ZU04_THEGA|nr:hypothetical protein BDM02DRAFT_3183250 [Thelephora ganbajun]
MHHVFQIDELVKEITRHMFVWNIPQHFVLDWALTCKTISDPALDVLWETQDSLINLLKTLPSDVWEMNRRKLHFTRIPTRCEWSHFEKYRRRIYNMQVNEEPNWDGLSTRVYQLLDLYFPNGSFLPNLQRLTCFIDWEHFTWIKLFLSPSLLFIDLNTFENNSDPIAGPMLEFLPMETLQALHLEDFPLDTPSVQTLSNCLLRLSGPLQELITYHKISDDAAAHISQLSNLRVLGISFRESNFVLPGAVNVFPSLKRLYAQVDNNLDWLDLLKNTKAGLRYLSISWVEGLVPPPDFTQQLVSVLHTSGARDTLRVLRINASRPWNVLKTTMVPLLSLHNLTNLEIHTPCHTHACAFDLADEDVAQLASSLRKLKTLILGGPRCVNPPPKFTMDGLFFLSKYCTSLLDLEVHFNAPQSRIFDHSASSTDEGRVPIQDLFTRASNCDLRWLYVHELPFPTTPNSVGIMTYFLIHIFPHLETIAQTGSFSEPWAETQRGIQAWQAFRRITVPAATPEPMAS